MCLYTTQAKYLHKKLRINFLCPLPLTLCYIIITKACVMTSGIHVGTGCGCLGNDTARNIYELLLLSSCFWINIYKFSAVPDQYW